MRDWTAENEREHWQGSSKSRLPWEVSELNLRAALVL